jgi:hypothetical protein
MGVLVDRPKARRMLIETSPDQAKFIDIFKQEGTTRAPA